MSKSIYLAGGCFWGCEKYFSLLPGVTATQVGYANGQTENPSYEQVCREHTGHAETVKVTYDPQVISLPFLLACYFEVIDPTAVNRQGGDVGTQYRTGIYYVDASDQQIIAESLHELQQKHEKPIAVEAKPLENFYAAEAYHQKYLDKNPGGYCHIGSSMFEMAKRAVDPGK